MQLLVIAGVAILISNSIKLAMHFFDGGEISQQSFLWHYLWAGKFPSTHSALLSSVIFTIWFQQGLSLFFYFSLIIGLLFMYTLLENKKRYLLLEEYYQKSSDGAIRSIALERRLAEFEGHTFFEVVAGVLVGILAALLILQIFS